MCWMSQIYRSHSKQLEVVKEYFSAEHLVAISRERHLQCRTPALCLLIRLWGPDMDLRKIIPYLAVKESQLKGEAAIALAQVYTTDKKSISSLGHAIVDFCSKGDNIVQSLIGTIDKKNDPQVVCVADLPRG